MGLPLQYGVESYLEGIRNEIMEAESMGVNMKKIVYISQRPSVL